MNPRKVGASLAFAILVAAHTSVANIPWFISDVDFAAPNGATILMSPNGNGPPLTQARDSDGQPVDATITAWFEDWFGDPVQGVPAEDFWLSFYDAPGTTAGCVSGYSGGMFFADGPTDAFGRAFFTQPLQGGGWSLGPASVRSVWGDYWPLDLRVNSPDIDGDLAVNLADLTFFAGDYFSTFNFRSDLYADGVLNLADISLYVRYIGAVCERR